MATKKRLKPKDLAVVGWLLALSFVPTIGAAVRLLRLSGDGAVPPEDARFVAAPAPVLIHVLVATAFCLLGAFQFSAGVRARWPRWHRGAGKLLAVCGLSSAATGLWMTAGYAIPASMQGPMLFAVRMAVGIVMIASIAIAWSSILRRDVARHEAFMIRAYALGQGAGTQALVLGPWTLITGETGGLTRDALMTLAWLINAAVAEWVIVRRGRRSAGARLDVRTSEAALQPGP